MTQGVMYLPAATKLQAGEHRKERRTEHSAAGEQPLAPWFLDIPALRAARFEGPERERRFRLQLERLMELFASSQIDPADFRERLIALLSSR
jgi:hypothetical protein